MGCLCTHRVFPRCDNHQQQLFATWTGDAPPPCLIRLTRNVRTRLPRKIRSLQHILQVLEPFEDLKAMAKTRILGWRSGSVNDVQFQFITIYPHLVVIAQQVPGEAELG